MGHFTLGSLADEEQDFYRFARPEIRAPRNKGEIHNSGMPFLEGLFKKFYEEKGFAMHGGRIGPKMDFQSKTAGRHVEVHIRNLPKLDYSVSITPYTPGDSEDSH